MRTLSICLTAATLLTMAASAEAGTFGGKVSLNPQPLPPRWSVLLNPQPLPPGIAVMINPQPLPPRLR